MLHHKVYMKDASASTQWLTLVHGAGGSSTIWFKQIREFKKHYNVLVIDLRGHGKSKNMGSSKEYSFEDVSRDVIEVLDELKIESSHFVGISLGTIIIRVIAELDPQRVSSMVLGGAITRLSIQPKILISVGGLFKRYIPYMWLYKIFAFAIMPYKSHKESRILFINEAKKVCQKEFLKWFKLTRNINPLLKMFEEEEIKIPTLYLMGEEDYMFLGPVEMTVQKSKFSTLHIIQDAGHVCNVDQPERFNQQTIAFLAQY